MKRLYVETTGLSDWEARVTSPNHWKRGRSAFELAVSWETSVRRPRGLPTCISELLDQQDELRGAQLLFGFPEHKVALKGSGFASQSDFWALLRGPQGLISLAVEAKAGEEFDLKVSDWLNAGSSPNSPANRRARLQALCHTLGVAFDELAIQNLRYQLLHRCASALLEARRSTAPRAVLLVQCFDPARTGWGDFEAFAQWLGISVNHHVLSPAHVVEGVSLHLGWADCPLASDTDITSLTD